MALYSDKVMDHFRNPRNLGKLDDADGIGEVGNAKCGDIMRMYIKVDDGIITDVKFNTFGCGSAIATSSMATELIKGKPIEEALDLSNKAVVEALDGLPTHKIHCRTERAARRKFLREYPKFFQSFTGKTLAISTDLMYNPYIVSGLRLGHMGLLSVIMTSGGR